jgi:hypothetical protein
MEMVLTRLITTPECYAEHPPKEEKVRAALRYFEEHGRFDKPVVVTRGLVLTDNYTRLLVAEKLGIEKTPCHIVKNIQKYKRRLGWPMQYIVGVFESSGRTYTWKNPKKIPIYPGDQVLVQCREQFGNTIREVLVTVDSVFYSEDEALLRHRDVVGIWY